MENRRDSISGTIIPFRLIRYNPNCQYKVLMTTRNVKTIRLSLSKPTQSTKTLQRNPPEVASGKLEEGTSNISSTSKNLNKLRLTHLRRPHRNSTIQPERQLLRRKSTIQALTILESETHPICLTTPPPLPLPRSIIHCRSLQCSGCIPHSREGGTAVSISNSLYLFGGLSRIRLSDLLKLSIRKQHWKKLQTANEPPGKLGHSAVPYNSQLFIFGGSSTHKRKCSKKLYSLSLKERRWTLLTPLASPTGRRNHAACIVGKTMVLYGGVDSSSHILSDLHILDLPTQQ